MLKTPKKFMIKAVIFDMDGVISHTQIFHSKAESEALKEYGISMPFKELMKKYAGIPDKEMFKKILERFGKEANIDEIIEKKWVIMDKFVKKGIKPVEDVEKLIRFLYKNGFALAVASASPFHFIKSVIKPLKIENMFKSIACADEVTHGKPDPEIFLLAAKKLKIKPVFCIVIEDSSNGVEAAKRAGMKCVAITTTHKREELKNADKIIDSFKEINIDKLKDLNDI